ncbi:hypothetical protein Lal_00002707 [Lupinus albus]|nr:hypothetical protein Lal_00002707 [Lupinus albus]
MQSTQMKKGLATIFLRRKTTEHSGNSPRSAKSDSSSSSSLIVSATSSNTPQIGLSKTPAETMSSNHTNSEPWWWWWLSRTAESTANSRSGWLAKTVRSSGGGLAADSVGESVMASVTVAAAEEEWDLAIEKLLKQNDRKSEVD